jgi:hypothetical protein
VAGEYSVARPTAKACLERLTAAGFLQRTAHRTAVVPELGVAEILDLYFARDSIERRAVQRLAELGTVPDEARRAQENIERAVADKDFGHQVEADIAFHTSLVDAVGSKRLSRMHELIMGEVHLTMGQFQAHRTTDPRTVAAEHGAILRGDRNRRSHGCRRPPVRPPPGRAGSAGRPADPRRTTAGAAARGHVTAASGAGASGRDGTVRFAVMSRPAPPSAAHDRCWRRNGVPPGPGYGVPTAVDGSVETSAPVPSFPMRRTGTGWSATR